MCLFHPLNCHGLCIDIAKLLGVLTLASHRDYTCTQHIIHLHHLNFFKSPFHWLSIQAFHLKQSCCSIFFIFELPCQCWTCILPIHSYMCTCIPHRLHLHPMKFLPISIPLTFRQLVSFKTTYPSYSIFSPFMENICGSNKFIFVDL